MKTTVEIPDELYRQAEARAAQQNRQIKELMSDGLMLVLGLVGDKTSRLPHRMTKPPVTIRPGNVVPALSNDGMAMLLERSGERLP